MSATAHRWAHAIGYRGAEFVGFGSKYFGAEDRRILLIAGIGFDPRAPRLAEQLAMWAGNRVTAVLLREERPSADERLRILADAHAARLAAAVPSATTETISIFDEKDLAVIGGRRAAAVAGAIPLNGVTDIVVDLSALSVGTSFPLVGALLERADQVTCNLHTVVVADAVLDAAIVPQPTEAATAVHGFGGGLGLDSKAEAARLWLPQLAPGRRELLDRIFRAVAPHDVCPILPFPAHDPRIGDALIEDYLIDLDDAWEVDTRNMIYAAEDDPLDVYRTIVDLNDAREPVFDGDGGSLCVLSPVGSKVLALGALMAAAEKGFEVRHVEAIGYTADPDALALYPAERGTFAHVWLTGAPYPTMAAAVTDATHP